MKFYAIALFAILFGGLSNGCSASAPIPTLTIAPMLPASETPTASPVPASPVPATPVPTTLPPGPVHIIAVGDVMLGRQVNVEMIERKDFTWPFLNTADTLKQADLTMGNLEDPIVSYCRPSDGGDVLCADPRAVAGLTFAGFDVMSLSNNHILDYGSDAFDGTDQYLKEAKINPVYMGSPVFLEINNNRVGVVAFDDSETELNLDAAIAEVNSARGKVDILIAILHWGYEYHPTASTRQEKVGHALIDAGVDLIIGAHPHWRQNVEMYNNRVIFYSLGNFVFDQMWSEETRKGNMADITITPDKDGMTITYDIIPIEIFTFGQPDFEKK